MRYFIRWIMCFGCILYFNNRVAFAADPWTPTVNEREDCPFKYGIAPVDLEAIVQATITEAPCLNISGQFIQIASVNPSLSLLEDISINSYEKAKLKNNPGLMHDVALRLLARYEKMIKSENKTELGKFLTSKTQELVDSASRWFQRDYIILWQAIVFYMKMVQSVNDPTFIRYSQQAFNLADAHQDTVRSTCVVELFTVKFVEKLGRFVSKKIIDTELDKTSNKEFLKEINYLLVKADSQKSKGAPPSYEAAVAITPLTPPPPYVSSK